MTSKKKELVPMAQSGDYTMPVPVPETQEGALDQPKFPPQVSASEPSGKDIEQQPILILVIESGWVLIGRADFICPMGTKEYVAQMFREAQTDPIAQARLMYLFKTLGIDIRLSLANCIRQWGTTKGLGQLALEGIQTDTKLDPMGIVTVPGDKILFVIDCLVHLWDNKL